MSEEEGIFFGRGQAIRDLSKFVLIEKLVVLYGRSGLGKSSLLNAGVIPRLKRESDYRPLSIRFGAWTEGKSSPLQATLARLVEKTSESYLRRLYQEEAPNLWNAFKAAQSTLKDGKYILFFDQFEELFTYPEDQILEFKQQLAELLYKDIPQRYREGLEAHPDALSEAERNHLFAYLDVKAVFAIRSDRMSLLDQLSDVLPAILHKRYELKALNRQQAETAILNPAYSRLAAFSSEPFDYEDETLDLILDHLSKGGKAEIESFQLQIICQYAERISMRQGLKQIAPHDLGELEQVFKNYYDDQIASLGDAEAQLAARRLIEDGLIFEEAERRLTLFEGQILSQYKISSELLRKLVDSHLLRAEPDPRGGFSYELSHDTLVAPILVARRRRVEVEEREAERQAAAARLAAEQVKLEEEREKRKKARRIAIGGITLAAISIVALGFAVWFGVSAGKATKNAEAEKVKAIQERMRADSLAGVAQEEAERAIFAQLSDSVARIKANQERMRADRLAGVAQDEAKRARLAQMKESIARVKADSTLVVAVEQERQANQAKKEIQQQLLALQAEKVERVTAVLKRFPEKIMNLDYEGAEDVLKEAVSIKANPKEVKQAAAELIFYYGEIGKYGKAYGILEEVEKVYGLGFPTAATDSSDYVDQKLSHLVNENQLRAFQEKYYPNMMPVQGGVFIMGDDSSGEEDEKPEHGVQVSDFSIAQTELTVRQYVLYAESKGITLQSPTSWGWKGNHPMVNVNWDDAQAYASWLSEKTGQSYRLPTEAEWEFAAGGGVLGRDQQGRRQYKYAGSDDIDAVANNNGNSNSTMPVAGKQANQLGLYDMSGNVWEWCEDYYGSIYYAQCARQDTVINPAGHETGNYRVRRGGGWFNYPQDCRAASRSDYGPEYRSSNLGFRLVVSPR